MHSFDPVGPAMVQSPMSVGPRVDVKMSLVLSDPNRYSVLPAEGKIF